jgi:hypothetical protein
MALANVQITDTFDVWRTRTNQIIVALEQTLVGGTANSIIASFNKANSANYLAFNANANTIAAFDKANTGGTISYLAFDKANAANISAGAAFNKANIGSNVASIAYDRANAAYGAYDYAANVGAAGNSYMTFTVASSALAVGTSANAYAASYASAVGAAGNSYTTAASAAANNIATAAFNKANNAGAFIPVQQDTINISRYIAFINSTSGNVSTLNISTSGLTFNPGTGVLTATTFNSSSDETLKQNVVKIDNGLEVINQLDGVKFNWKRSGLDSYGVIAQDIEKVLPELVSDVDGIKNVNYDGIIAFLIEAIKELNKKLENR